MYGYLHQGRVLSFDEASGGYNLQSVGLARTSRWGPVPSAVPGLLVGDRVVLGATGASRDNLVIIAKVGMTFPGIADIPGLTAALAGKADDAEIASILAQISTLDGRLDAIEPIVSGHTTTLGSHATALGSHASELVSLDGRLDLMEAKTGYVDAVTGTAGRPTTGLYDGRPIYRKDKGFMEFYDLAADKWRVRGVVTVGALADITDPVTDQVAFLGSDRSFHRWNGSSWVRHIPGVRTFESVQSGSSVNITTTLQDLPGVAVSFTTIGANSSIMITATVDGGSTGISDIAVARCEIAGFTLGGEIHWGPTGRATYSRTWRATLVTAGGAYTVKLRALKTGSVETFTSYQDQTNMTVTLYDA